MPVVTDEDGLMVAVHPDTQIVRPMVAWVTEGLIAPGVRAESGRTAPAGLIVMPPLGRGVLGLEVACKLGGALVPAVIAADELSAAVDGPGVEHPETVKAAKISAATPSRFSTNQVMHAR